MEPEKNKKDFRLKKVPSINSDNFDIYLETLLAGYEGDESTQDQINSPKERTESPEMNSSSGMGVRIREDEERIERSDPNVEENVNTGAKDESEEEKEETGDSRSGAFYRASKPDFVVVSIPHEDRTRQVVNPQEQDETEGEALLDDLIYESRPSYLSTHLDILTLLKVTTFTENSSQLHAAIQGGLFLFGSILSITLQTMLFKDYLLAVAKRGNMYHYISLGYTLNCIALQITYAWINISNKIGKMMENVDGLFGEKGNRKCPYPTRNKFGVMICLFSMMSAIVLASGLDNFLLHYEASAIVQSKSYRLSAAMHAWSKGSYAADTEKIWDEAETLKLKQFPLMGIQMVIEFVGWLNIYLIKDLMTSASLDIYQLAKSFKAYLDTIQNLDDTVMNSIWMNYEFLYKISEGYERCFGILFIVNHVHNLLFCSYFLVDYLTMVTFFPGIFVVRLVIVIKIIMAYGGSVSSYGSGGKVQKKLHDLSASQVAPGRRGRRMREEISFWVEKVKYRPVGIGSGHFRVAGDFVFRFVGYVVSGFLCFLRAQEEELAQVVE